MGCAACIYEPQTENENIQMRPQITSETDIKLMRNNLVLANTGNLSKNYKILKIIGSGTFGKVYKVYNFNLKQIRALKVVKRDSINFQDDNKTFLKEIEMLMNLDHPNIIKIFEYYIDELNYYVILELAEGGELYQQITQLKNFKEKHIAVIMQQIGSAVCYMHSKDIVHRDIKPENIMLDSKESGDLSIKIIDFGTSNFIKTNQKLSMKIGTPYYVAPEVLAKSYNSACDIWSVGVIMYILFVGYPPFDGPDDQSILKKVKIGKYELNNEEWDNFSPEAKDLVQKMLTFDQEKRIKAEDAGKHNWFKRFKNKSTNTNQKFTPAQFSMMSEKPFDNLRKFNAKQKIQQATIAFGVHHVSSSNMLKELKEIFRALDVDGNGTLSYEELKDGFNKYSGSEKMSDEEFDQIMNQIDADKNECIEYEEFIAATINGEKGLSDEHLRVAFNAFDKDGSKELSVDEIKDALGGIEEETDTQVIKDIIKEIDINGDGTISFEEFKELMLKVLKNTE